MANVIKLEAEKRSEDKNPRQLRAEGKLPATVYGKGMESVSVQVVSKDFIQAYKKDNNASFELNVDSKKYTVVAQQIQKNYATNEVQSVEFKVV